MAGQQTCNRYGDLQCPRDFPGRHIGFKLDKTKDRKNPVSVRMAETWEIIPGAVFAVAQAGDREPRKEVYLLPRLLSSAHVTRGGRDWEIRTAVVTEVEPNSCLVLPHSRRVASDSEHSSDLVRGERGLSLICLEATSAIYMLSVYPARIQRASIDARGRSRQVSKVALARRASEERHAREKARAHVARPRPKTVHFVASDVDDDDDYILKAQRYPALPKAPTQPTSRQSRRHTAHDRHTPPPPSPEIAPRSVSPPNLVYSPPSPPSSSLRTPSSPYPGETQGQDPPLTLADQVHLAYSLEDFHTAKVLLLQLKGYTNITEEDIAAVKDEDFDYCFIPYGRLSEEPSEVVPCRERSTAVAQHLEQERKRTEWLNACERIWEDSKCRLRAEREQAIIARRKQLLEREMDEHRQEIQAEEQRLEAECIMLAQIHVKRRPRGLVAASLALGRASSLRNWEAQGKASVSIASSPDAMPQPTSTTPRCGTSILLRQHVYHPTNTITVPFRDVVSSMKGPLFPLQPDERLPRPSPSVSPATIHSRVPHSIAMARRAKRLADLFEALTCTTSEQVEDAKRKGKAHEIPATTVRAPAFAVKFVAIVLVGGFGLDYSDDSRLLAACIGTDEAAICARQLVVQIDTPARFPSVGQGAVSTCNPPRSSAARPIGRCGVPACSGPICDPGRRDFGAARAVDRVVAQLLTYAHNLQRVYASALLFTLVPTPYSCDSNKHLPVAFSDEYTSPHRRYHPPRAGLSATPMFQRRAPGYRADKANVTFLFHSNRQSRQQCVRQKNRVDDTCDIEVAVADDEDDTEFIDIPLLSREPLPASTDATAMGSYNPYSPQRYAFRAPSPLCRKTFNGSAFRPAEIAYRTYRVKVTQNPLHLLLVAVHNRVVRVPATTSNGNNDELCLWDAGKARERIGRVVCCAVLPECADAVSAMPRNECRAAVAAASKERATAGDDDRAWFGNRLAAMSLT
ncbi:hypothetical protein FISHEDRAFT_55660 [Fistulina hepatica ATCC 64428]|uniref:Uncharacterized protein n=1 Tax=Fistulina hepatica ATCC 64428 TaxID=1128425 RepID=A0A0D7AMX3_9AGAR|nr:hypothetical protein FISHEDRAFT_55660 [Fistulina hepatica ATCC 64428]